MSDQQARYEAYENKRRRIWETPEQARLVQAVARDVGRWQWGDDVESPHHYIRRIAVCSGLVKQGTHLCDTNGHCEVCLRAEKEKPEIIPHESNGQ